MIAFSPKMSDVTAEYEIKYVETPFQTNDSLTQTVLSDLKQCLLILPFEKVA